MQLVRSLVFNVYMVLSACLFGFLTCIQLNGVDAIRPGIFRWR